MERAVQGTEAMAAIRQGTVSLPMEAAPST